MTAETIAYKLLSNDEELNSLLDKLRGKKFGLGFKQGIFTYDIPERPTNALSKELAPFMRIYPTYENDIDFLINIRKYLFFNWKLEKITNED